MTKENKARVAIISLGCPRNLVDSEHIMGNIHRKGYPVTDIHDADVAVINTCAFIDDAKKESIDVLLDAVDLKKRGRLRTIIVSGCLAQRYKDQLRREVPEIDAFVGTVSLNHNRYRFPLTPNHYAYLKICEGCIHACSYCIIPRIKGKFQSLDRETILKQAARFNRKKISELNLIGQELTGYGLDARGTKTLGKLLKDIVRVTKNIGWIRLLYLYPDFAVIDEILDIMKHEARLVPYLDLPIQHISEKVLRLMNRKVPPGIIYQIIERARKKIPNIGLRTSLIVGFPQETDRQFQELLAFVKDVRFERLGAFMYSNEEGTPASLLPGQIPEKIKRERFDALMRCQQEVSLRINRTFIGKTLDVLVDESAQQEKDSAGKKPFYLARSHYDAPEVDGNVFVRSKSRLSPGQFIKAKIVDSLEYDLIGETIP